MKMLRGIVLVLAAGLAGCGDSALPEGAEAAAKPATGKKVELKFQPPAGSKFGMSMEAKQHITQGSESMDQTIGVYVTASVEKATAEGVKVRYVYDRFTMKQSGAGARMDIDTMRGGGGGGPEGIFAAMIGKGVVVETRPDGEVVSVEGADALREAVVNAVPGENRAMARQQMEQMVGDEALKQQFGQMSAIYPGFAVDNGSTWKKSVNNESGIRFRIDTTYKLLDHDEKKAEVGVTGTIGAIKSDMSGPGGSTRADMSGKQSGTMTLDLSTGLPTRVSIEQDMSGDVSVGGRTVSIKMRSTNEVTCVTK